MSATSEQVQLAVDSVRALLPQIEQVAPEQAAAIRDALSQLQMAFVQVSGGAGGAPRGTDVRAAESAERAGRAAEQPGGPGPAQQSGRLWVPGQ